MKKFLGHYIKSKKGKVLNQKGDVIGHHDGALLYTEGERHGFQITKKSPTDAPLYVLQKNIKANTLIVGDFVEKEKVGKKLIILKNCNWISGEPERWKKYFGRIRYRQPLQECRIRKQKGKWEVIFKEKQKAVSPGQSLVLYDGDKCMGGGVIM